MPLDLYVRVFSRSASTGAQGQSAIHRQSTQVIQKHKRKPTTTHEVINATRQTMVQKAFNVMHGGELCLLDESPNHPCQLVVHIRQGRLLPSDLHEYLAIYLTSFSSGT